MVKKLSNKLNKETEILIQHSLVSDIASSNSVDRRSVESDADEYPYCALKPDYFAFALSRMERGITESAFSVQSWDNRTIVEVLRKQ